MSNTEQIPSKHFENYKELKYAAREEDPTITKEEIYEKLLRPFKHEKYMKRDPVNNKFRVYYVCKYINCDKEFTKTWNLLDHVRMHEGIKPYQCSLWRKSFTQKGNLKKHLKQHTLKSLKERKRFTCEICNKKYTERYNLIVSIFSLYLFRLAKLHF